MAWNWFDGRVLKVEELTAQTRMFTLKVESEETFHFEAGQFITLDLPFGEKKRDGWRSYSIANEPNDDNILELCIVRLEGGLGTSYLFDELQQGDILKFKGPAGNFTFGSEKTHDKHVVCVCTGTGIAPFRSMWRRFMSDGEAGDGRQETGDWKRETGDGRQEAGFEPKSMHVIFGTRTRDSILFEDEMRELAAQTDRFSFDICLSRENIDGYEQGYVHPVYQKQYKNPNADTIFYLCGWSNMVDEAVLHLLSDLKVDRKQIVYELYG